MPLMRNPRTGITVNVKPSRAEVLKTRGFVDADAAPADSPADPSVAPAFDDMTVAEIREYATEHSIDLGDARKRDDILAAIHAAK